MNSYYSYVWSTYLNLNKNTLILARKEMTSIDNKCFLELLLNDEKYFINIKELLKTRQYIYTQYDSDIEERKKKIPEIRIAKCNFCEKEGEYFNKNCCVCEKHRAYDQVIEDCDLQSNCDVCGMLGILSCDDHGTSYKVHAKLLYIDLYEVIINRKKTYESFYECIILSKKTLLEATFLLFIYSDRYKSLLESICINYDRVYYYTLFENNRTKLLGNAIFAL